MKKYNIIRAIISFNVACCFFLTSTTYLYAANNTTTLRLPLGSAISSNGNITADQNDALPARFDAVAQGVGGQGEVDPFASSSIASNHAQNMLDLRAYGTLPNGINCVAMYLDLFELSENVWWTWHYQAEELFAAMAPELWVSPAVRRSPERLLAHIPIKRFVALAGEQAFIERYQEVMQIYRDYMDPEADTWARQNHPELADAIIPYSSLEFGIAAITQNLQSGGLGALAGDHMKEASDLGFRNLIGVGLAYELGYFTQQIDAQGNQHAVYSRDDFDRMPKRLLKDDNGKVVHLSIPLYENTVHAQVWQVKVGRCTLYLLDTDIEENEEPWMKKITQGLYTGDHQRDFHQAYILGVGQMMLFNHLGVEPDFYHLNESHAAFAIIELIKTLMDTKGLSFEEALITAYYKSLFTIHTPIAAGNWKFQVAEPQYAFERDFADKMATIGKLIPFGCKDGQFNLAQLLIHLCGRRNGVSDEHGGVARRLWSGAVIDAVLNGVSIPNWQAPELQKLLAQKIAALRLSDHERTEQAAQAVEACSDEELWDSHCKAKRRLIHYARHKVKAQRIRNEVPQDEIDETDTLFDEDALTITVARRFATYKRSDWLFSADYQRLVRIMRKAQAEGKKIQIIFAGKAHPHDKDGGQKIIFGIHDYMRALERDGVRAQVVFLENYDLEMAHYLEQGSDIWLSYPQVEPIPMEASATSGEKAAMSMCINAGLLTGFMRLHLEHEKNAFLFTDINQFYDVLEEFILPNYYGDEGRPTDAWMNIMRQSMLTAMQHFGTDRMIADYTEQHYAPGIAMARQIEADDYALAKKIAAHLNVLADPQPVSELSTLYPLADGAEIDHRKILAVPTTDKAQVQSITIELTPESAQRHICGLNADGTIEPIEIVAHINFNEMPPDAYEVALMYKQGGAAEEAIRMVPVKEIKPDVWEYRGQLNPLVGTYLFEEQRFMVVGEAMVGNYQVRVRPIITFGDLKTWPETRSDQSRIHIVNEVKRVASNNNVEIDEADVTVGASATTLHGDGDIVEAAHAIINSEALSVGGSSGISYQAMRGDKIVVIPASIICESEEHMVAFMRWVGQHSDYDQIEVVAVARDEYDRLDHWIETVDKVRLRIIGELPAHELLGIPMENKLRGISAKQVERAFGAIQFDERYFYGTTMAELNVNDRALFQALKELN